MGGDVHYGTFRGSGISKYSKKIWFLVSNTEGFESTGFDIPLYASLTGGRSYIYFFCDNRKLCLPFSFVLFKCRLTCWPEGHFADPRNIFVEPWHVHITRKMQLVDIDSTSKSLWKIRKVFCIFTLLRGGSRLRIETKHGTGKKFLRQFLSGSACGTWRSKVSWRLTLVGMKIYFLVTWRLVPVTTKVRVSQIHTNLGFYRNLSTSVAASSTPNNTLTSNAWNLTSNAWNSFLFALTQVQINRQRQQTFLVIQAWVHARGGWIFFQEKTKSLC